MSHSVSFNLEAMRNADIRAADPAALVDIREVKVNTTLSQRERIFDFINQVKNPYLYKCGKMIVKVSFAETEATLEDKLETYLLSL